MADEQSSYDFAKDVGLEQDQPQVGDGGNEDIRVLLDGVHETTPDETETETETIEFEGDLKGKTPTEISAMFKEEQAKTLATAVSGGTGDGELAAMKAQLAQLQQQGQTAVAEPSPVGLTDEEWDEEYANNPVAASRKIAAAEADKAAQRYGPLLEGTAAQLQETQIQLRSANDPQFAKYKGEVEKQLADMPAGSRYHKDALGYAWDRVQGRHIQDIVKDTLDAERAKQTKDETAETAATSHSETGSTAPRARAQGKARTVRLTMADQTAARNMGVSVEDYARHIKKAV